MTEYDAFIKRSDAFYAAGETTVEAKKFYQRYAVDWSTAWGNLAQVVNNEVTVTGTTRTVWTKPRSIELGTAKGDVVVRTSLPRRVGSRRHPERQRAGAAAAQGAARLHDPAGEAAGRRLVALG